MWFQPNKSRAQKKARQTGLANLILHEQVKDALRTIYDPEIPVNIYDLGLIYHLDTDSGKGIVEIKMTLTSPNCPVAQSFPASVEHCVSLVAGVKKAHVKLVWTPPWTKDRMSEEAKLQLDMW